MGRLAFFAAVIAIAAGIGYALYTGRRSALEGRLLAEVDRLEHDQDCCRDPIERRECREALVQLAELSHRDGPMAERARMAMSGCPVARELDAARAHPPEERLCGVLSSAPQRLEAARALGRKAVLQAVARGCPRDGLIAALSAATDRFPELCAADACLPLLVAAGREHAALQLIREHPAAVLAALLKLEGAEREQAPLLLDALLPGHGPALWTLVSGQGAAEWLRRLVRATAAEPGPVRLLRSATGPQAAARASVLLYAAEVEALLPDEEARALEAFSCEHLGALLPWLHLEEQARHAALHEALRRCPLLPLHESR
jgi:hypothetical protein